MMKKGWRPRRTLVFVSWTAKKGAARIDRMGRRSRGQLKTRRPLRQTRCRRRRDDLRRSAVHSLTPFLHELAQSIQPEGASRSLYDGWLDRAREQAPARDGQPALKAPPVGALGSGSDYTAFLDHIGVASLDMGLNGRGGDGSYHSTYDNPTWFKKYIDPKFSVLARRDGRRLPALVDAEIRPFNYETYGRQILEYIGEIEKQATPARREREKIDFAGNAGRTGRSPKGAPHIVRARRSPCCGGHSPRTALRRRRWPPEQPADHGGARSHRAGRLAQQRRPPPPTTAVHET